MISDSSTLMPDSKIYVAGHCGLVGSAIVRKLEEQGFSNLLTRKSSELNLRNQDAVNSFFEKEKPEYVFLAAAKVGGILANDSHPADFILNNLQIQTNVIDAAYRNKVKKLMFFGTACIYPRACPQPIKEEYLLTGPLEVTNQWYAIAKISGIRMCQAYRRQYGFNAICVMPNNLYGPGDNFDLETSHVLPALIRKCHKAKINNEKELIVWGTGKPQRELLYVDDLADACLFLMQNYDSEEIINIGTGKDFTIEEIAQLVKQVVGFDGELNFDTTKPDGTPKKLLDATRLTKMGWQSKTSLREGILNTYEWAKTNQNLK
jgi:GDP-L-fucose synthase